MRTEQNINSGWRFCGGDIPDNAPNDKNTVYMQAKTECRLYGAAAEAYDDSAFKVVSLPHDYIIEQAPSPSGNEGTGYFCYHNAWYRKRVFLPREYARGRVSVLFGGVATHARVYVNGCLAYRNFCGYTPFEVDITDFAKFGSDNTLAVYVDTMSSVEGWWYQGGGIYEDVKLVYTENVRAARWGLRVRTLPAEDGAWHVPADIELENFSDKPVLAALRVDILDEYGNIVATANARKRIYARSSAVGRVNLRVQSPRLWNVLNASMYTARARVRVGGALVDEISERFGFRTISFSNEGALMVNGAPVKINGVCAHGDFGLTGRVMSEDVARYRVKLMREMGANGFRCAHYPHSEAEMRVLDDAGMIVMAETRWFSTEPEALKQLETLIRRDRNHPSICFWSVGNEEPLHAEARGARIAEALFARIRALDGTRPLTTVVCHDPLNAPVFDACDVIALNYHLEDYDALNAKYPSKPFVAGELCATGTTRGWYKPDDAQSGRVCGYDHDPRNGFSAAREYTHAHVCARKWVAGGFQWAAIEHRGECKWPRLCSASGALDMFLMKKDAFYQNQSHWTTQPMIHILPHWTRPAPEGEMVDIWVYTNCEQAELFLNGVSLGRQSAINGKHAEWRARYTPGELRAAGYINGGQAAQKTYVTAGAPAKLTLKWLNPDGAKDILIECGCVDAQNNIVPDAAPLVEFSASAGGAIIATGSDNTDHAPPRNTARRMYAGGILCLARKEGGAFSVTARAEGLGEATLHIPV